MENHNMQGLRILATVVCLIIAVTGRAETVLYKYTDEAGQVYFTDRPPADVQTEQITIQVQSFEGQATIFDHNPIESRPESITIYTADWCRVCHRAKKYMDDKGYQYIERDIEKHARARREFDRLGGKGVPVILVGKKRMNGFSPGKLEQMLADN
jgi:glutaredoxin